MQLTIPRHRLEQLRWHPVSQAARMLVPTPMVAWWLTPRGRMLVQERQWAQMEAQLDQQLRQMEMQLRQAGTQLRQMEMVEKQGPTVPFSPRLQS